MNKIIGLASLALILSATVADAQNRHNNYNYRQNNYRQNNYYQNNYYYRNNNNWVGPAIGLGILGGVIAGGALYNNYYSAPPVQYYTPPATQCWNQTLYDQYGRMYVETICE